MGVDLYTGKYGTLTIFNMFPLDLSLLKQAMDSYLDQYLLLLDWKPSRR